MMKHALHAVHASDLGGAYPNFMMDDEDDARLKATYGDNCKRLAVVKGKCDPANLFRVNQTSSQLPDGWRAPSRCRGV